MFPNVNATEYSDVTQETQTMGKSFLFDFEAGDFVTTDGKLIQTDNLPALKVWVEKILKTERFKFKIYGPSDYGVTLSDLASGDYSMDFKRAEIEREIRDSLLKNTDIYGVHSFAFGRAKRSLLCEFAIDTKYGSTGGEITI